MKEKVFYNGHQMLGDNIGFCAAAHCFFKKTNKIVKVHFQESRKEIINYFDGLEWVPKDDNKYNFIDCGRNPTIEEFKSTNGVKRFYKNMDASFDCPVPFDIHFNIKNMPIKYSIVGIFSHANTATSFPEDKLNNIIQNLKIKFKNIKFVCFGMRDNRFLPNNVIDLRQSSPDIHKIINYIRRMKYVITPHSGPAYIAAGFKIPSLVYRTGSINGIDGNLWDNLLNFDNYKPTWIY